MVTRGSMVAVLIAWFELNLSFFKSMALSIVPPPPNGRQLRLIPISRPATSFTSARFDFRSGSVMHHMPRNALPHRFCCNWCWSLYQGFLDE